MNCNCKNDVEAALLDKLKAQTPDGANHSVTLDGYGLAITGNKMSYRPKMAVNQSVDIPRKSGGFKNTKPKLTMFFSYCPFCGEKIGGAA